MINLNSDFLPYFRNLSPKQLKKVTNITKLYNCKNGDIAFLQGEFCNKWIIIYSGSFLIRKKNNETIISEKILLEGEIFDFENTLKDNITGYSLEGIGDCSIIAIDLLGLKELSKKNPVLISLIKLQLIDSDAKIWENNILKTNKIKKSLLYVVKSSFIWSILNTLLINIFLFIFNFILFKFFYHELYLFVKSSLFLSICIIFLYHVHSRLTYIEVNRESITKKEFSIKKMSLSNSSIPLDNLNGTKVTFSSRFFRIMKIGQITAESATESLSLKGVYNPGFVLKSIEAYRFDRVHVDKAIELSSFKSLFSKQNNLFHIDSDLENDVNAFFSFRKSPIYLLVRVVPPILVFTSISILLFILFNSRSMLLINIFTAAVTYWFYIDWKNDRYAFEGNKVIDIEKKPLFGKENRIEVEITSIQSIKKEHKNIFHILFNYGDIEIVSFGGKLVYPSIHNPDNVIENLYLVKKYYKSKQENKDKLSRQEEFINYTKYYQELTKS